MTALDPSPMNEYDNGIVIGIDKDKYSLYAVKWAINNLVLNDQCPVFLVHVRTQSLHAHPASDARIGRAPTEDEMHQLFLPYRGFCARKGIDAKEVVLHDIEISSALLEYIKTNLIRCVVVGASNRNVLTRKFKAVDVPTSLGKLAPDYCAVYAIGKGKVQCIRPATATVKASASATPTSSQGPSSPRLRTMLSTASSNTLTSANSTPRQSSSLITLHQFLQYTPSTNAPTSASTNTSWVSTSSDGVDRASEGDTPNKTPIGKYPFERKLVKSPELKRFTQYKSSFPDQSSFTNKGEDSTPDSFWYIEGSDPQISQITQSSSSGCRSSYGSTVYTQDPEAEMQKLRLQLQERMEALKHLQNEADTTQQMAKELDVDKSNTSKDVKWTRETTAALTELEKQQQEAAKEVADISEQLADMEIHTEKNRKPEEDERKGATEEWTNNGIEYRKYTLKEIEIATDYFSASLKIGEGGYGLVYRSILDDTQVAIKVLRPDVSQGLKQFQKEIEVLSRMRHPNLVLLLGACPDYGCLVYEYMDYGSLEDRLFCKDNTPPIPWRIRFKIAAEIANALHFLHSTKPEPLVHRDLKPANILLDHNFVPKICDVGLARLVPPSAAESITQTHMTAAAGTFFYIDPEYQQTGQLSVKSDVYSLGVMLLQIITGRRPMGLSHAVENAIEEGNLAEILDPAVEGWPMEEALSFARMALKCCELRKRDRPDLGLEVLPELTRLSACAIEGTTSTSACFMSYGESSCSSSSCSQESVDSNSDMDSIIQPSQLRQDEGHSSSSS